MAGPLRHVSDTALWVAMYRALEWERPDALVRDPWARQLAGAPLGWREEEFRSTWEESLRLERTVPPARLWNLLSKLRSRRTREAYRRMSGVFLLERA